MIDLFGSQLRRQERDITSALLREVTALRALACDAEDERLLALKLARHGDKSIIKHAAHMFSQNFEDAIIAEIVNRLGPGPRTFVEIGTETGEESNTRLLLKLGWNGLWIEGSSKHVARGRQVFAKEIAEGHLQIAEAFVSRDNAQKLIEDAGLGEIDFLSIDVDMMTSHIWDAISTRPRFACIEYNGNLPPTIDFEIPYDDAAVWGYNAWYGASLKALERIGKRKAMSLVGCDLMGINAFFVRDELTQGKFVEPFTAETHWEPIRLGQVRRRGHKRP